MQKTRSRLGNSVSLENPSAEKNIQVSVVLPCLNEAETLRQCIEEIQQSLQATGLCGEIIVADNGSIDGSIKIARTLSARVVRATPKGYGAALRCGIEAANAPLVLMGDADASYHFSDLPKFVDRLNEGYDLVVGNRFRGGIEQGAMPWSHRWIGNPVLSFLGRVLFPCDARDFHCGLRAVRKSAADRIRLQSDGMELASEMLARASLKGLRISEIPTGLRRDGRSGRGHLRSIPDGWRHLKFLFLLCPRWLFLMPAATLILLGGLLQLALVVSGGLTVLGTHLSVNSSLISAASIILGVQLYGSGMILSRMLEQQPFDRSRGRELPQIERHLLAGGVTAIVGFGLFLTVALRWGAADFGNLPAEVPIRQTVPAVVMMMVGSQWVAVNLLMAGTRLAQPPQPLPKNEQVLCDN
ncbi:MAG: glycosyltransferase family 2 protein [Planctomycetota bacterium]